MSYTPGQGVVLARNPNYHGSRPHHFARIAARGRDLRPASVRRDRGRHRRLHGSGVVFLHHARRARRATRRPLRARQRRGRARTPTVLRQPGPPARLLLSEHPPDAVQRRTRTPSGQLRDRPPHARSARRLLRAGARTADRPLPAAGNARLPRRTRLSDHTQPSQSARARQGGARRWPNRRPYHL